MPDIVSGVLARRRKGNYFLLDLSQPYRAGPQDIVVPPSLVKEYRLSPGAGITGSVSRGRKGTTLAEIHQIGGFSPERFLRRKPYTRLSAVDPCERFRLSASGELSMRVVDLIAPIGKGTRGMIVSPPKAGKTMLIEQIARAIRIDAPETRIIVLLIDERPEEVTHFRRSVEAEVVASASDRGPKEHVELAELMLAHIQTELECGRDVVVLVDSLTRMGRVFNLRGKGTGRTLSGGLEAGALEIPRRFFGLARNVEDGGSVTIIATALIETGSRMDELIFQEFKGTGNSEIVLDRKLAEARIFPAINISKSGTRKEDLLYSPEESQKLTTIRRGLAGRPPQEAMLALFKLMEKYPTNEELLKGIPVLS